MNLVIGDSCLGQGRLWLVSGKIMVGCYNGLFEGTLRAFPRRN